MSNILKQMTINDEWIMIDLPKWGDLYQLDIHNTFLHDERIYPKPLQRLLKKKIRGCVN